MDREHLGVFGAALVAFAVVVTCFLPQAALGTSATSHYLSAFVIFAWAALPIAGLAFGPAKCSRLVSPLCLGLAGAVFLALGVVNAIYWANGLGAVLGRFHWPPVWLGAFCVLPFALAGSKRIKGPLIIMLPGAALTLLYYGASGRIGWITHINGHRPPDTPEVISLWGDFVGCLSLPLSLGALLWLARAIRDERVAEKSPEDVLA